MLEKTRRKMLEYAQSLPASHARAQCITIANYTLCGQETIADRIYRDHSSRDGHLRAAFLTVQAGVATERKVDPRFYGSFTFEDGSILYQVGVVKCR